MEKETKKIICGFCKNEIIPGNDAEGLPAGLGFVKNGEVINVCRNCIIKMGMKSQGKK